MLRYISAFVLALVLTGCDLSDEPIYEDPPPLIPLAVGNAWPVTYSFEWVEDNRGDEFADTIRVVSAIDLGGESWHEVSNMTGAGFPNGFYTNRPDGVYYRQTPDADASLLYKYPAQVGDSYGEAIRITVVATNALVLLPHGLFEAYVYEFEPTEAWAEAQTGGYGLAPEAGVHQSYFIPGTGYARLRLPWLAGIGGTEEVPLFETVAYSTFRLNTPPVLLSEDDASAVPPSARADAQRHGGLGAEAGLLGGGEGAPVPVMQGAVERPE